MGIFWGIPFPNPKMHRIQSIFVSLFLLITLSSHVSGAPTYRGNHAQVELLTSRSAIVPGERFQLALRFDLEPHWHLYWKNPGASGFPPEVEWELPEGFEVGPLQFPAPKRYELGGLVSYGHEGEPLFLVDVQAPEELGDAGVIRIKANAYWLICKDVCIADEAVLDLEMPIASTSEAVHSTLFEAARAAQAQVNPQLDLGAGVREGMLEVKLRGLDGLSETSSPYFYPLTEGLIDPNAAQAFSQDEMRLRIPLAATHDGVLPVPFLGVLEYGAESYAVEVNRESQASPVETTTEASMDEASAAESGFEARLLQFGLGGWVILAFLGGLILNIMPCVLPVLSLKVFSLLKHTGQSRSQALGHGLAYTLGVVASFVALAAVLFALRAAGELIGWGYQLQSPGFTLGLGVLFFVFALNLLGVFEIGVGLVGADSTVAQRNDLFGSFGMGVLAAVVGAPCMGPLVASVSGLALQIPVAQGLAIFAAMGLGLASPFLLLAIFPRLVSFLPKPGVWMETFKQFMGFLLLLAVLFIAAVIGRSGGVTAMMVFLFVLFLAAFAAWIYGRWAAPVKSVRTRRSASVLAALLLATSLLWGIRAVREAYAEASIEEKTDGPWATWSPERVAAERALGNPVFVDFTATWCLICQANKIALRSDSTTQLFEEFGVQTLEADWTLRDPVIAKVLQDYDRAGVPLYLLYDADGRVLELPQNLTNASIRSAVEQHLN